MDTEHVRRPRVARETRLLVTAALLAVAALWALARLRFPERDPGLQVMAPILAPLVPPQGFSGLEGQLADVAARTSPSVVSVAIDSPRTNPAAPPRQVSALRLRDDLAVALPAAGEVRVLDDAVTVARRDGVTGLAVLRLAPGPVAPMTRSWLRQGAMTPRYAMQTTPSADGTSLVPVVVAGLTPTDAPQWSGVVWMPGGPNDLAPGAFLFTPEGEWIGLVFLHHGMAAIAPADLVSRLAESRLSRDREGAMSFGVDVQTLTPALADVLGLPTGVVVTWVAPAGPARDALRIADVLHEADGRAIPTMDHWHRYLADLGDSPTRLKVWRDGHALDVTVTPVAVPAPAAATDLPRRTVGITARPAPRVGAEITAIEPDSLAESADLRVGDVITRFGSVAAPTPAQVRTLAAAAQAGRSILVALTRDGTHRLTVIVP